MKNRLLSGLTVGVLVFGGVAQAENEAIYNPATGSLSIPTVIVGSDSYNVDMQQQGQGLDFGVINAAPATSNSTSNVATFNTSTGSLSIPTVVVGAHSYTVVMQQQGPELNFTVTGATELASSDTGTVMWQGREWQKNTSASHMNWYDANTYCEGLTVGGHDDWVLPTAEELRDLIVCSNGTQIYYGPDTMYQNGGGQNGCEIRSYSTFYGRWITTSFPYITPTISSEFTFATSSKTCWASTTSDVDPNNAWSVSFSSGALFRQDWHYPEGNKPEQLSVRCVRGGS